LQREGGGRRTYSDLEEMPHTHHILEPNSSC
jgi:hypothetical protein